MHKKQKICRVCGNTNLKHFLDLDEQPLANAFLRTKADGASEQKYPLRVSFCENCSHVQLQDVVDAALMFRDYVYVSSTSPVFIKHFEDYADYIFDSFGLDDKLVVDIGSNDGVLLKPLKAKGARVLGVDPAEQIAKKANQEGIETIIDFFSSQVARQIVNKHGLAGAVTANNAFAHIDDWDEVVRSLDILLAADGVFVIEAPYLLDFIKKKYFDTTYHEHLNYLAIRPLEKFFARKGYEIFAVQKVKSHGGSIRVFIKRKADQREIEDSVNIFKQQELEQELDKFSTYQDYADDIEGIRNEIVQLLKNIKKEGKKVIGYGAAAKGNTLLNYMNIDSELLDYIVDDSPLKQNLYTPGTLIPVLGSEKMLSDNPDYVLILAWNFAEPIIDKCKKQGLVNTKFIVPLPEPIIIN